MTSTKLEERTPEPPRRGFLERHAKAGLMASVATVALLMGSFAYAANSAVLFSQQSDAQARTLSAPVQLPGFADLVSAVKPAVVQVRVRSREAVSGTQMPEGANPFEGTPFERFFRQFGNPGQGGTPFRRKHYIQGLGSGFFVSADGYIVTNNHVVQNAVKVDVVMQGGKTYTARVIGTDPKTDLALIKIDGRTDFPFVRLAEGQTRIGDWVVAMGNPFGLGGTVTSGIVSAKGRDIGSGPYDDYIQIDAPVNRGNSGGPTFNLKGEVIGVNTAIFTPSGGSVGIAFDIPASVVRSVIPQLQEHGYVSRGWLGVQIQSVTPAIADGMGLKTPSGALVTEPQPGSPAAKAGLKSGDVIQTLDGQQVKDSRDLARKVASLGPGKSVKVGIVRDGQQQTIDLTLAQQKVKHQRQASAGQGTPGKNQQGQQSSRQEFGHLGLTVAPAEDVEGAGDQGLAVISVDPDGKAAEAGLKAGDIILKAGNKSVSTTAELVSALDNAKNKGRSRALILIKRDTAEQFVAVPVATG